MGRMSVHVPVAQVGRTPLGRPHVPDGQQLHPSSRITIKHGQVVRVEPVDPAAYSKLVQDSS